jgi:acetyltransferase-like isoleucine patch superfamily enzyme
MDFINDAGHACNAIAVADGEVVAIQNFVDGFSDTYTAGNYVRIKHESGVYSRYLHLVKGSVKVKVGQKVKAGTVLGTEGNTGYSCGTHLHFDINDGTQYVDPLPYLMGEKSFYKTKKPTSTKITVGSKVRVKAGATFSDGTKPFSEVYNTVYDVQLLSRNGKEARIGIGDQWTGWMYISDLYPADQPAPSADVKTVKVGGKVKVNAGATFSDGTEPYPFVYTTIFDVITMSKDGKEALIGIGTDVTGWMYVKDLKAE